LVLRLNQETHH
jgi:hypothetical protein